MLACTCAFELGDLAYVIGTMGPWLNVFLGNTFLAYLCNSFVSKFVIYLITCISWHIDMCELTRKYMAIIPLWIFISTYIFWDFVKFCQFVCCLTLTANTTSIKHVSDKVPRAKWPHWMSGNILFLLNLDWKIGSTTKIPIFIVAPPFGFSSSN